jgi:ribose/xylose/arabinose/galactoside ABC-type transport system permease subunit
MKANMGVFDRAFRIVAAVIIGVLYFAGAIQGVAAAILGVVAVVFLGTGLVGFCPGYAPFHISTRKASKS